MKSNLRRKLLFFFGMMLLMTALANLPACTSGGKEGDGEETPSETPSETSLESESSSDSHPDGESTGETETETPAEEYINPSQYPMEQAGAKTDTVLLAADFGVKGDGVTDDGPAISRAVTEAAKQQATLRFDAGKTYYIASAENSASVFSSPFAVKNASGFAIDGGGSIFLSEPGLSLFVLTGCADVRLSNMIFDYAQPVYLVGTVKSVAGGKVTYTTDLEPYVESYNYSRITAFSIQYNEGVQNRPHRFLTAMKKTASHEVQVTYQTADHGYRAGDKVFLPNPGIGHVFSECVYLGGNTGALAFENITVRSAPSFVFAIKSNDAEMYFQNLDLMPDTENGREIHMVSWRDGFHCKDNRRPLHWDECDVGVLFDDVYNISGTLGYVTSVQNQGKITVTNYEFYSAGRMVGYDCRVGDVVDVYNPKKNIFCGTATVREVTENPNGTVTLTFDYGETLSKVTEGCVVGNRETCAPGSTITDCRFTGTFRLLRDIRVERTTFAHLRTWIKVEGGVEGPLPGNIDFVDCTIKGGVLELGADGGRIAREIKDIGFFGCTFENVTRDFDRAASVTESDEWTEADLFTVKNLDRVPTPTEIRPTELDLANGVTYDWTRYTMSVEGGSVTAIADIADETVRTKLAEANGFADHVLVLTGHEGQTCFALSGLSVDNLPLLHKDGGFHVLTIYYYTDATEMMGNLVSIGKENEISAAGIFSTSEKSTRTTVLYYGADGCTGLCIEVPVGETVYIGEIRVSTASAQNPTDEQLAEGHTFTWSNHPASTVTVGETGQAMRPDEIADASVREAILAAESGFAGGTVLHLDRGFGAFSGLTDELYYTPGKTYHLSLDAYIASPMKGNAKIYLLAMDDTPGNRVLAEGLFTGEGFWHFEMDWTVGTTGERSLMFYINETPTAYPDIYLGDFTVTVARSQKPDVFLTRDDYHTLSAADLKEGYTFDFSDGHLMNTGKDTYADMSALQEKTAALLRENGFGDTVYYCNENFTLGSLPDSLTGGRRIRITLQVYDIKGNLSTSGARGVFVMLHMQGGVQNSGEVNYKAKRSDADPRLLTLTFESTPPAATDDLLFYQLSQMEFFVGSVTVEQIS